jgi:hypothetical protein
MSFGALMVLAGIIAAIAVVTNNSVLIVGAMIVSPDYGPMAALSVALGPEKATCARVAERQPHPGATPGPSRSPIPAPRPPNPTCPPDAPADSALAE